MGNKTQRVRKGNAYGNSSLNDFHLPLPKPKRHKPKRPKDSGNQSVNISGESVKMQAY